MPFIETKVTLTQAARLVPGRPNVSTLWRWCRRGLNGIRLEYVRFGRKIYTTSEALDRFAIALAAADLQTDIHRNKFNPVGAISSPTPENMRNRLENAAAVLQAAGIKDGGRS